MCGRFSLSSPPEEVRHHFGYDEQPNFPPRYNIAPTQPVAIVRAHEGKKQFHLVRWGLIPSWVKDPKSFTLLINARSETAHEKPAFRAAIQRRRCLIPANGFYEWQRLNPSTKRPYWVRPQKGGLIGFAAIWESWQGPEGEALDTVAVLTTAAPKSLEEIHHRVPVVIPQGRFDAWLGLDDPDQRDVQSLLITPPEALFEAVPVSVRVNAVANDDPALQERINPEDVQADTDAARIAKANAETASEMKTAKKPSKPKAADTKKPKTDQLDLF